MKIDKTPAWYQKRFALKRLQPSTLALNLIVLSAIVRLRNLDSPISGSYTFRTTQTAWGIRSVLRNSWSPFSVETPVLGSPWKIPFEFPLYQITAGLFARVLSLSVESSGRLVSIIFFSGAAAIFYKICRHFLEPSVSLLILGIFLFNAHNLEYGSAVLIEYCALFFALGSFLALLKYFESGKSWYFVPFVLLGSLCALVKVTTSIIWLLVGVLALAVIRQATYRSTLKVLTISVIAHVPSIWWTRWADNQKSSSVRTQWLTSRNLGTWNFGTLRQRIFYFEWDRALVKEFLPSVIGMVSVLVGLLVFGLAFTATRRPILGWLFLFVSGPVIFTNLYFVHDYYWTAVLPALMLVIGLSVHAVSEAVKPYLRTKTFSFSLFRTGIVLALLCASWFSDYGSRHLDVFAKPGDYDFRENDNRVSSAVNLLQKYTEPTDQIIVVGADWNPRILYFSDRRGLMVPSSFSFEEATSGVGIGTDYKYLLVNDVNHVGIRDASKIAAGSSIERVSGNLFRFLTVNE